MTKVKMLLPDQLMNYNTATHIGTVTGSHFKPSGLGKLSRFFFSGAGMLTRRGQECTLEYTNKILQADFITLWKRRKKNFYK